ncbi:Shedu immune nuclease family protein [Longimicrobium sp.]|uniref:Shedu immune nuclease family protein n=1 Tax=Longimicrobium sp. TaxID=2029185 RepID=UPI002BD4E10C|nr:Shedu immune nuclease family protein [Longimicrobium sp.]HSU15888.1 Shedu immune nuclease family protein [Longimicrobium sp.]
MSHSYRVESTSSRTARVEDIWLHLPENQDTARTRRILRVEIIDNPKNNEARVKACILHQRRHSSSSPWHDVDAFNLTQLKAGQEVRIQLDSAETLDLYRELERLYRLGEDGVPRGKRRLVVADEDEALIVKGPAREILEELHGSAGDQLWELLSDLNPNLFRAVALAKLHEIREQAVVEFEVHLTAGDWSESEWQNFFENNTWIFGYGLSYRFLSPVETQPHYGGTLVTGTGGQQGDFLAATEAEIRFTVLVEIKTPDSTLVGNQPYRNKVHLIGRELAGGVAQLQSNCRTWEIYGATNEENRGRLETTHSYTVMPKGILIIGHTRQLDTITKRTSFELFRRNLVNPEVITFDELLQRARHLLLTEEKRLDRVEPEDDLPF